MTVTVTSSELITAESFAVSRKTYVPPLVNDAVVTGELLSAKVTVPGPLTTLQETTGVTPAGKPSSVTEPARLAVAGNVMVRSGPALTSGALLSGLTTVTVKLCVSNAPRWSATFTTTL